MRSQLIKYRVICMSHPRVNGEYRSSSHNSKQHEGLREITLPMKNARLALDGEKIILSVV